MKSEDTLAWLAESMPGLRIAAGAAGEPLWTIAPIGTGSRASAAVRVGDRWIDVEAALAGAAPAHACDALIAQSGLAGGVKILPRGAHVGLRAEVPRLGQTPAARAWVRRQVACTWAGMCRALARDGAESAPHEPCATAAPSAFDAALWAERCAAAGWPARPAKNAAAVHVELASGSLHRGALLGRHCDAIRAAVTLDTGAIGGAETRHAVAAFLLRSTRALRWVRAFASASDDTLESVGFECFLAPPDDDAPLVLALDALATACAWFGREAEALARSAELARIYLDWDAAALPAAPARSIEPFSPDSAPDPGAVDLALA
jgi:hypothetical protein